VAVDGLSDGHQAVHQIPADDYHTWRIDIFTRRSGPITPRGGQPLNGWPGLEGAVPVGQDWRKTANKENGYLMNREIQRTRVYAGIPFGPHTQDAAMTESMGAIADRENEHLGVCDAQPAAIRQLLLRVVRDVQEGKDPPGVAFRPEDNNMGNIALVHATVPEGLDPFDIDAVQRHMICSGSPLRTN
jgi:hypothetical protein